MSLMTPRAALLLFAVLLPFAVRVDAESTLTFTAQWQVGLFKIGDDCGTLNPHVYRPDEFAVNDMIYQGLTAWDGTSPGVDGIMGTADDFVVGSLAESWSDNYADVLEDPNQPYEVIFNLRPGVTFHDGAAWNAAAAVVNFDHVMGGPKRYRAGFSDWYGLPAAIASWEALSELEFKVTFYYYYDNTFRELTFIRPFRFASPLALPDLSDNKLSCTEWKPWEDAVRYWGPYECVNILAPVGTGPYKFRAKRLTKPSGATRDLPASQLAAACSNPGGNTSRFLLCEYEEGEVVSELLFDKFDGYTPTPTTVMPTFDVAIMRAYADQDAVLAAMVDGSLDMAYGDNALSPSAFVSIAFEEENELQAHVGPETVTRFFAFNSGGALNTSSLRKMAMCVMDGARRLLFEGELPEEKQMNTLFQPNLPYVRASVPFLESPSTLCASSTSVASDLAGVTLRLLYPTGEDHIEGMVAIMISELYSAGIQVKAMPMPKNEYEATLNHWAGADEQAYTDDDWPTWPKDFPITTPLWDIAYSATWGPSYDATTSITDITYSYPADAWSEAPNYIASVTKAELNAKILGLAQIVSNSERQEQYTAVFTTLNEEALFLPISAQVNVAVTSDRLSGFAFNPTQFGVASVVAALYPTPPPKPPPLPPDNSLGAGAIVGIALGCAAGAGMLLFILVLISSERKGTPIFARPPTFPKSSA